LKYPLLNITKSLDVEKKNEGFETTIVTLLLLSTGLFGSLGDFAGAGVFLRDRLDDPDGDRLPHVADGESTERRIVGEGLDGHWLRRRHLHDRRVTVLDALGESFELFAGTTIAFLEDLLELAGDVSRVAIHDGRVSVLDFTGMVQNDDLSVEVLALLGRIVLRIGSDVSTTDFLDGHVLDVETNVVAGKSLGKRLVVHLYRLHFGGDVCGREADEHAGFDDARLDSADGHRSDAADLVDVLERQTKGLIGGAAGRNDRVEGFDESETCGIALVFGGLGPALLLLAISVAACPPSHLLGLLQHIVAMPSGDGAKDDLLGIVPDLLDVTLDFLTDLQESALVVGRRRSGVHLVNADNELLDAKSVGEKRVLTSLAVLGDASLELSSTGGDDQDATIGLGCPRDHVLDEISVSRGINDGDVVIFTLELPQGDIDGNTTFTLGLELVQNPGILEGPFTHLLSLLLELLDDTLVDAAAFVNEMAGGGRFTRIYVANYHDVDVQLFLNHFDEIKFLRKVNRNSKSFKI